MSDTMNEEKEPPLTMTIGEYHWKRGRDGRYVMHDGFAGGRYQCGVTESLLVERLAAAQGKISRMKMQSATEALAWSLGQMWVSVREQLPDDRTYCLVIASDDDSAIGNYQFANYTKQYGWAFSDDSIDRFHMKVSHWVPLPEPPRD